MSEFASTSLPQWRDPLEEFAGDIERAQTLGLAIYENDMVATWATDALMARRIIPEDGRLRGYFVTCDGESREAHFIGQVGEDYCELYTVGFGELSQTAATVLEHPSHAPLAGDRKAMFLAWQTAVGHPVKRFTEAYNTVVLPGSLAGETGWLVYLLAATTEPDTALLGGHYRLRISEDGSTVESATALSGSLLRFSPCPNTGESLFVTYGLSQVPIETHVYFQLLYRVRLEVGIMQTLAPNNRFVEWCVEDGKIGVNTVGQPSLKEEGCADEGKDGVNTVGQLSVEVAGSKFELLWKSVAAVFPLYWLLRLILPSLIPALDVVWVLSGSLAFGYAVVGIAIFKRKARHLRIRDSEVVDVGKSDTGTPEK